MAARPDIDERTSQLVSKGRWQVPGYKVWEALIQWRKVRMDANCWCRRNLETFLCFRGWFLFYRFLRGIFTLQNRNTTLYIY